MTEELKTSAEWNKIDKVIILDPDGWDRRSEYFQYSFYEEKITKDEYEKRLFWSTISIKNLDTQIDKEILAIMNKTDELIWSKNRPKKKRF